MKSRTSLLETIQSGDIMKVLASMVLLASLSCVPLEAALSFQPAQNPPRANTSGPTVAQIRAAPFGGRSELSGQTAGTIERLPQSDFPYRYQLPDAAIAMFGHCGADGRCDRALFVGELGSGGAAEIEAMGMRLFAYNGLYVGNPEEQFRIVQMDSFGRPGKLALVQAFALSNRSDAAVLHSRYGAFVEVRAAMRARLGGGN